MTTENVRPLKRPGKPPVDSASLTSAQKAAVVLALLGEDAARPIMQHLDDEALSKVNNELETVALLPRMTLVNIIVDFLNLLESTSTPLVSGRGQARSLVNSIFAGRNEISTPVEEGEAVEDVPTAGGDVWAQFASRPIDQISEYLNGLTPNLIAIIMTQLPVDVSSNVTERIDEEKLAESMGYMVEAQSLNAEIKGVLERMIEMEFLNREQEVTGESDDHLEGVGELLSLISGKRRENVVSFLRENHAEKLESLERSVLTIEDLPVLLPRSAVPVIFRNMERDEQMRFLSTLTGSLASVSEFILANISTRLADQLKDDLSSVGELAPAEVELVHRSFLKQVMELKRSGEVILQPKESSASEQT